LQQVWRWNDPRHEVTFEMNSLDDGAPMIPPTATSKLALAPERVIELLVRADFERVQQIDGRLFQPVIFGYRAL